MALSKAKSFENLQMNFWCSICHEPWTRPKTLPCEHIYCEECLEKVLRRSNGTSLNCPECRATHTVPLQGLHDSWKTTRALENLADDFRSMSFSISDSPISTGTADPVKSFIRRPLSRKVAVGQTYSIVVQLCDDGGQPIPAQSGAYNIEAYVDLKPKTVGFERKELELTFTKQGNVSIEYQVQSCGVHEFIVQLESRPINGSPLGITVVPRGILGCEVRGPLKGPWDVVCYQGNFLITDGIARVIYLVDQTGQELQSLKVPPKMAREFAPVAIAVSQEKIFVTDISHRCVHVYGNLNDFPKQFGNDRLQKPTGVAVSDDSGDIFIVDNDRKLVIVYSQDYRYMKTINYPTRNLDDALFNPQMMAINTKGDKLYITDHGDRGRENSIKIINSLEDKLERKVNVRVGKAPARPNGIDVDKNGNVYVSVSFQELDKRQGDGKDGKADKPPRFFGGINVYNSFGQFLGHFGSQVENPNGLVVLPPSAKSASIVYVADSPGRRKNGSLKGFIV